VFFFKGEELLHETPSIPAIHENTGLATHL